MVDYDSNLIKPVDDLKNITGLGTVKHREERKRRQQFHQEGEEKNETIQGGGTPPQKQAGKKNDINADDIGVDYCA
jgi:hypothetical protein